MAETSRNEAQAAGFKCPECGSERVRRSAPRTPREHLIRALSPFHRYKCRDCEHRGWHLGKVPARHRGASVGRPLENRDIVAARKRRGRLVSSLLLAISLGVATGLYFKSCQQRSSETAP